MLFDLQPIITVANLENLSPDLENFQGHLRFSLEFFRKIVLGKSFGNFLVKIPAKPLDFLCENKKFF